MLNCRSSAIPSRERVVTCAEVFELKIPLRDVASMQCRQPSLEGTGEVPLRRLVKEVLRMGPSRIIVGEVRPAHSLDLPIALNSGFTIIALILIVGAVDVTAVQLSRSRLLDVAASAALDASGALDKGSAYQGGLKSAIPITDASVRESATEASRWNPSLTASCRGA